MTGWTRRKASLVGTSLSAALLAACAIETPYTAPKIPFLSGYNAARTVGAPVLLSNAAWWRRMHDPALDRLMALALQGNLSLESAKARVLEARAQRRGISTGLSLSPSAGLIGADSDGSARDMTGTLELGLSWMLDPYGARRAERRAAGARVEVAEAEVDAARLLVLLNMGNAYVDLRYRQRLLTLREQEMRGRRQTLATTRTLLEAEAATRLEATRSEARVAEIESQIPGLRAAITAMENEIAVLAGVAPGRLPPDLAAVLRSFRPQPRPDLSPEIGIPTDLLRNRPDIFIAERSYYAAIADLDQARAALYPRLSLTGSISLNALSGGRGNSEYFFGPSLVLPVIPGNAARAGVEGRSARVAQAHTGWKSTVLTAILEVENALLDYRAVSASRRSAARASQLYRETLQLTREVFASGDATLGDLVDAEQALAIAEQAEAEILQRQGQSFVALNVRLGAGHAVAAPEGQTAAAISP